MLLEQKYAQSLFPGKSLKDADYDYLYVLSLLLIKEHASSTWLTILVGSERNLQNAA